MGQEKIVIGDKSFIVGGFYERQIGDSPIKSFCKIIAKIDNADDLLVYGMRDPYDPQKSLSPRFDVCIIPVGDVGQELSEIDIKDILGLFAVQAKQCVDSSMAEALNKLIDFPSQS